MDLTRRCTGIACSSRNRAPRSGLRFAASPPPWRAIARTEGSWWRVLPWASRRASVEWRVGAFNGLFAFFDRLRNRERNRMTI
eukprot:31178-Pelagococcus_subviridis.AAC.16